MNPGQIIIRGALLLGLLTVFLVVMNRAGSPRDDRRAALVTPRPAPEAAVPSPTPTVRFRPTLTAPPRADELCDDLDSMPDFPQAFLHDSWGQIIGRVYCDGLDLKYVTYIDSTGRLERTYLYEDGSVRVKLYYAEGSVVNREDFDEAGNLVPNGTYVKLPNNRIGPGRR